MKGYAGRILRVNLTEGKILKGPLNEDLARKYIGGRGLNSRFLYDEVPAGIDPLGAANKIMVGVGPCNGTLVPGSQRFTVTSKSPLTGIFGDSNAGGSFGAELKYAGYDMIIIEGQAQKPVYLWIDDDNVELKPAEHIWGKTIREARRAIEQEVSDPDICTIAIGQGGENLVRFACLIADLGRGLGRTGQGAVFGSKKLKAIAVRGTKGVKVADPDSLAVLAKQTHDAWREHWQLFEDRRKLFPLSAFSYYQKAGMFPTKNYQQGTFWKTMTDDMKECVLPHKACFSCPAPCNHMYVISKGPYAGTYGDGLELSQAGDFGPRVGNDDSGLCLKASTLCDEYGVDIFDMGASIAFAMECWQRGILTAKDTGGLKLEWGSADAILGLIEMIIFRQGIGDILAEGLKRASEKIGKGSERYAIHNKGQTLVMREPRASKGWGLMYAVSTRGPCHMRASLQEVGSELSWDEVGLADILKKYKDPKNPLLEEGKAELVKWHEDLMAFKNSLELCVFFYIFAKMFPMSGPQMCAQFYNSVTGLNINEDDVLHIGERITNVEKAFNAREGLTRKDDTLPDRFLKEPMPDGVGKGQTVKLQAMLDEYYEFRGWDKATGLPTREKLLELELGDIADELEAMGKLAT